MQGNSHIKLLAGVLLVLNFYSCKNADKAKSEAAKNDSIKAAEQKEVFPAWHDSIASQEKGIIGIFEVPEMISLCKLDSVYMKNVSARIVENFSKLEKDLNETGSETDVYQGIIYYNNNPENFKFECFVLIKKIPAKQPKRSQIVILESSPMLIYNYYGAYENAFTAYKEIKTYISDHKLVQIGPIREYYPMNQSDEKDEEKKLTRMMVPVVREIKKPANLILGSPSTSAGR